ncbi:pre-peptidase C-terminal domain-containing protein [Algicola sagamiensis]|uniref:pre-peptidase C-terminal domain-containing protein n=1 Tax=Algicola sagamiensis TaxID=163869 RepID=UPI000375E501|nr:pre-peptidase C-terminal domain-containing protein [Algicola sagamiensis]
MNKVSLLTLLLSVCHIHIAGAFNSEEHKLIADLGGEKVVIHQNIKLPPSVTKEKDEHYLAFLKEAKRFAVGFDTNDSGKDYDKNRKGVQDNAFWSTVLKYRQIEANQRIWIPKPSEVPASVIKVDAYTGVKPTPFSLGELVALYGDFRRTTYCDTSATCYLTNHDIEQMKFERANYPDFAPKPIPAATYLRYIASGMEPPHGGLGNAVVNSEKDDEIDQAGWWGDEMLRLANSNDWHFSRVGIAFYIGMHRAALFYVKKAMKDPKYWATALHYEANALHALTDFFALGHVITNRDETTFGMLKDGKLLNKPPVIWQEQVIQLGSGQRDPSNGRVLLTGFLPPITQLKNQRSDFLPAYRSLYTWRSYSEKDYHDVFNEAGAMVTNLNGRQFKVLGDSFLYQLSAEDKQPIIDAVAASVQSLFDASIALKNGITMKRIGAVGSSFFRALQYLPVFIEQDREKNFVGRYALSAHAIINIVGNRIFQQSNVISCVVPYLSGADWVSPTKDTKACTQMKRYFPPMDTYKSNWLASGGKSSTAIGNHPIQFEVTTPSKVTIDLKSSTVDAYLYLLKDNKVLASNDNHGKTKNAQISMTLKPGVYTIIPATAYPKKSGDFELKLRQGK